MFVFNNLVKSNIRVSKSFDISGDKSFFTEPGSSDNIFLFFGKTSCPQNVVESLYKNITAISKKNSSKAKASILNTIKKWKTIHVIDELIKVLVKNADTIPMRPYLHNFARFLAFDTVGVEAKKLGISLLGIMGCDEEDIYKIKSIACDEEYTLYCITTLAALLENADVHIWEIARSTSGWGRISSVLKLSSTKNPDIKNWLLLEGYHNTVNNEYTAYVCAVAGELNKMLSLDIIDSRVFASVVDIMNILLRKQLKKDIGDYKYASSVCFSVVKHCKNSSSYKELALLIRILDYVSDNNANWSSRKGGWTTENRLQLKNFILETLENNRWKISKIQYMDSEDSDLQTVAHYYGLDTWSFSFNKLQTNLFNPNYWKDVFTSVNENRMSFLEEFMCNALPWEELLSKSEGYLQYVVDEITSWLCKFKAFGVPVVIKMLNSEVKKHQNAAIKILCHWEKHFWGAEIENAIAKKLLCEKDKDTQARLELILRAD